MYLFWRTLSTYPGKNNGSLSLPQIAGRVAIDERAAHSPRFNDAQNADMLLIGDLSTGGSRDWHQSSSREKKIMIPHARFNFSIQFFTHEAWSSSGLASNTFKSRRAIEASLLCFIVVSFVSCVTKSSGKSRCKALLLKSYLNPKSGFFFPPVSFFSLPVFFRPCGFFFSPRFYFFALVIIPTSTSLQFVNMYFIGSNSSVACSSSTSNKVCRWFQNAVWCSSY